MRDFECRKGCGACFIAPSISSSLPGLPHGKPAGVRCAHLTPENLCGLYGKPDRPRVCGSYRALAEACGTSSVDALEILAAMESLTA